MLQFLAKLHVTCYMLHVTCYMLHVTCCMLHYLSIKCYHGYTLSTQFGCNCSVLRVTFHIYPDHDQPMKYQETRISVNKKGVFSSRDVARLLCVVITGDCL